MGEVSSACVGAVRFVTALPCSVSFLLQKRTANGRPYGVGRAKAFSLRRRWPANGGADEVSAPEGACPKDKGETDCTTGIPFGHHASVRTYLAMTAKYESCRRNETEWAKGKNE